MAVGIFDSGLGGLTVYQAIRQHLPDLELQYFSDNAHAPYGERGSEDIFNLTQAATERLWGNGCDLVILACNTASAIACRRLQTSGLPSNKHVLGVFVPMIEELIERDWLDVTPPIARAEQQVALFATTATVASRAYQRELSARTIGIDVEAQACSGLVEAIESGDEEEACHLVVRYVHALKQRMPKPQVAILGCTHFPIVRSTFQQALGHEVRIISQGQVVSVSLEKYLLRHPERAGSGAGLGFYCSGNAQLTAKLASKILGYTVSFESF